MAFNWILANTCDFETVTPINGSGRSHAAVCDVNVTKNRQKSSFSRYRFSISKNAYQKIKSERVVCVLSPSRSQLYLVPNDTGYYISKPKETKGERVFFTVSVSAIGNIDRFLGEHTLKYNNELDGYYISIEKENNK